jgi:hypothetical protein
MPSIWDGQALSPETQMPQIMQNVQQEQTGGWTFPEFSTLQEALDAARARSDALNRWRK